MSGGMPHSISVVIPCFNAGTYVRDAVDSALAQPSGFDLREVLIVDDRSDDPVTISTLNELAQRPKVRVIRNTAEKGAAGARNAGIAEARGQWVAFLDADDILLENAFATFEHAIAAFPDGDWFGADFLVWREDGSLDTEGYLATRPVPRRYLEPAFASSRPIRLKRPVSAFIQFTLAQNGAVLIRTSLLHAVGPLSTSLRMGEDFQLWIRLAARADFVFIPQPVLKYRRHDASLTKSMNAPQTWNIRALEELERRADFAPYRQEISRDIGRRYLLNAYHYRKERDTLAAIRAAYAALVRRPGDEQVWKCLAASLVTL